MKEWLGLPAMILDCCKGVSLDWSGTIAPKGPSSCVERKLLTWERVATEWMRQQVESTTDRVTHVLQTTKHVVVDRTDVPLWRVAIIRRSAEARRLLVLREVHQ